MIAPVLHQNHQLLLWVILIFSKYSEDRLVYCLLLLLHLFPTFTHSFGPFWNRIILFELRLILQSLVLNQLNYVYVLNYRIFLDLNYLSRCLFVTGFLSPMLNHCTWEWRVFFPQGSMQIYCLSLYLFCSIDASIVWLVFYCQFIEITIEMLRLLELPQEYLSWVWRNHWSYSTELSLLVF